ncbi:unnamed protein product [Eruca vesicaria subsp. sativa]|uniref:Uncharacterized protein n=1 Tax=Eruca vesicaria subsp. sativa TaxID=29727 RepID=A0ABC8L980_ERUVS|nr:unnamed protein product [Eruca vesicaria subsp. sativa]
MGCISKWKAFGDCCCKQLRQVENRHADDSTTILLASRDSSVGWLVAWGAGLLYVSAGLSVWSLVVYMRKISKVLLK